MSFFFPIPKSVKTPSVAGHKKRYKIFSCISFSLAETGFEPALPTSKSGRPLSLSAFSLRNSRFLACITFLLLPPAAVGAAAPETRRSQGIKKRYKTFFLVSLFRLRRQDLNLPCPPRNLVVRSPSLRSVCGSPDFSPASPSFFCHWQRSVLQPRKPVGRRALKKDTRLFSCISFSLAETGFEPATSGL